MDIKIALAGNPNSGKTTLFNTLTGSNQFVGNWPGVTVEKKEGKLKKHDGVIVTDLPGIYSLSPYSLEEVVTRNYLMDESPDVILNIVDGTNLERNLYLTTQLLELGIPVVIAINMMDVVRKKGDEIDIAKLSEVIGCKIIEISAIKDDGVMEAAEAAIEAAEMAIEEAAGGKKIPKHIFSGPVEHALAHIEEAVVHDMPLDRQRWYAVKIFERDEKILEALNIPESTLKHIEEDIVSAEKELDDDSDSIIANERYVYIEKILKNSYRKKNAGEMTASDKIDKVVTSRILGLPIFALIMFCVYWISMVAVGAAATDWTDDRLFGDGFHLFGIGSGAAAEAEERYGDTDVIIGTFAEEYGVELNEDDMEGSLNALLEATPEDASVTYIVQDEETLETEEFPNTGKDVLEEAVAEYLSTEEGYKSEIGAPDPSAYGEGRLSPSRWECRQWIQG